jgi:hypothetical protein
MIKKQAKSSDFHAFFDKNQAVFKHNLGALEAEFPPKSIKK